MRKFLNVPKRIHHAIVILSFLTDYKGKYAASLSFISKYLKMSYSYLEEIIAPLKKAALVKAYRGSAGGYRLNKKASDISILDVVAALEGKILVAGCLDAGGCKIEGKCPSKKIHKKLQKELEAALKNIKISDFK